MSCQLACYHPEIFAAVCCCSGAGQPEWIDKLKIPIMVIQGGADNVVTPVRTAKTVARMVESACRWNSTLFPPPATTIMPRST